MGSKGELSRRAVCVFTLETWMVYACTPKILDCRHAYAGA